MLKFPSDFLWGVTTAAYAIEGAWNEDGKGESIWDRFAHTPGNITDGSSGDIACDHYHHVEEDIDLMHSLGINSYRFSISWPRVYPEGFGRLNQEGLDFYNRLVDKLLVKGIKPFIALYQWDLPQALQDKGGWQSSATVNAFVRYAGTIFDVLGDRVKLWITHNEPFVTSFIGYYEGSHPPGFKDLNVALDVSKKILLSHGLAVQAFREKNIKGKIGLANIIFPVYAATASEEDRRAQKRYDGYLNRWFTDPLFNGTFPVDMEEWYKLKGFHNVQFTEDEAKIVSQPIDFLGICYFSRIVVKHGHDPLLEVDFILPPADNCSDMGWETYPAGLYDVVKNIYKDYTPKELYISENGIALSDNLDNNGNIYDDMRINYLKNHLESLHRALKESIPIKGYSIWSLLDNFEWDLGLSKRFGITYVNYTTLRRIPKKSFYWYEKVVKSGALE
jgi:beta-glucosidase